MKALIPLFPLLLLFSCQHENKFDLEKDLYQFSEKMENGDTLEINVNYSACLFLSHEVYTFIKENNNIFLQTHSEIVHLKKENKTYLKLLTRLKASIHYLSKIILNI